MTKIKSVKELPAQFYLQIMTELHNCIIQLRKAFIKVPGKHGDFFTILSDAIIDNKYKEWIMLTQALQFRLNTDKVELSRKASDEEQEFVNTLMDDLNDFHKTLHNLDESSQSDLLESFGFGDTPDSKQKNEEMRNEA
jgi:hypothetical protein